MEKIEKVYVITKGDYSDYHICAVTLDKERAQKLQKMYTDGINIAEVEEYIPNEAKPMMFLFGVEFYKGQFIRFKADEYKFYDDGNIEVSLDFYSDEWHDIVWVEAADEDHALKIARDRLAEVKAKKAGIV